MNSRHPRHHNQQFGAVWFLIPLFAIGATLLVLALLTRPAASASEPGPEAAATAPYVSSDPSLPSASSVFNDGAAYAPAQHVDTF